MKPSGIGGQAVIEGIMMRNKDVYSVAVRKPDNEIEVIKKESKLLTEQYKILNLPIIRGVINFVESLVVGTSTLTYSASFFEDPEEQEPTHVDRLAKAVFKERLESVIMAVTVLVSILFAVGLFMIIPYFASRLLSKYLVQEGVLNLIEGLIRVFIFILYIVLISLMKDIRRVYMYHGAEHKCINCIEHGMELNVENVRKSSKHHKRCGTSFLFFVMFISVIFFIFIRVSNPFWQVLIRLLMIPVIAGVSYEVIRWAGRSDNIFVKIISKPGMWLQALTTREPDDSMIEVAIKAVEEVFDWRKFLETYEDENKSNDKEKDSAQHDLEYAVTNETKQETVEAEASVGAQTSIGAEAPVEIGASAVGNQQIPDAQAILADGEDVEIESLKGDLNQEDVETELEDDDDGDVDMSGFEMIDDTDDDDADDDSDDDADDDSDEDDADDLDDDTVFDSDTDEDEDDDNDLDEDAEDDDGISFINEDDNDDDLTSDEIPIFKERKTDL